MDTHDEHEQPLIAKRNMTEDSLLRSIDTDADLTQHLDAMVDPCLLVHVDSPRFTVVGASRAFLKQSALSSAEVASRSLVDVLADAGSGEATRVPHIELLASLQGVLRTGVVDVLGPRHFLLGATGARGVSVWWSVRTLPIRKADGSIAYLLLSLGDLTETGPYAGNRDQLWIANDALDLLQAVRTIAHQAALLREAQVSASDHDPRQSAYVSRLQQAAAMLSERVDALLHVLSVSLGGVTTERAPIDLVALCRRAVIRVPGMSARCRVRVQRCEIPKPWGNGRLIEQGLIHLLAHLAKHSEANGTITAHVMYIDADRLRVTFESDAPTPGAREVALEVAQLRDEQRSPTERRSRHGLEMCLAHLIFDAHGGDLWPDVTRAGAIRWHATLPVERAARSATAPYSGVASAGAR